MTSKRILFLLRSAPYAGSQAYETLESLLVTAVFDQEVSVLFSDDGVYQLLKGQDPSAIGTRSVGAGLKALSTYGVERIYASAQSLAERSVSTTDIDLPVDTLDAQQISALIAAQDAVISG
jgi:tRNA 2-thiouridine synthesizing protein C